MATSDQQVVSDIDDPRLFPFRALKDMDLAREHGLFVAEGEHLLRRLVGSGLGVHSVLLSERRVEAMLPVVPAGVPAYVAGDDVIRQVVGYKFHSGILAAGVRPAGRAIDDVVPKDRDRLTVVACPELANAENLGAVFRIAAGFGADAIVLGERCADPFLRQCVRVSMGAVFTLPMARSTDFLIDLRRLRFEWGVHAVGTVLDPAAEPLDAYARDARTAVLFGGEAHGLDAGVLAACDRTVTIPMRRGTDSLNVAVAAAVVLYELTRGEPWPTAITGPT